MKGFNVDWATNELSKFLFMTKRVPSVSPGLAGSFVRSTDRDIFAQAGVVEKILERVLSNWRADISESRARWARLREAAARAEAVLLREKELCENLDDSELEISAAKLRSWIWEGASSLWQSGHYQEAIEAAIKKLDAKTQDKLGRRDVSEKALLDQAFGEQDPEHGKPRLHRMENDGSSTFKSVQRGARFFAEGVFAGIRNPLAHESEQDMPEQQALEYLAALSVLARWVDESIVVKAEP